MQGLSQMTGQGVNTNIQAVVLKKGMSATASAALELVNSATQSSARNPAHLGQSIDTRA